MGRARAGGRAAPGRRRRATSPSSPARARASGRSRSTSTASACATARRSPSTWRASTRRSSARRRARRPRRRRSQVRRPGRAPRRHDVAGRGRSLGALTRRFALGRRRVARRRSATSKLLSVACDRASPRGATCSASAPLRLVVDDVDRSHPLVAARSVRAEVGGALVVRDASGKKLQAIRVAGPRKSGWARSAAIASRSIRSSCGSRPAARLRSAAPTPARSPRSGRSSRWPRPRGVSAASRSARSPRWT